MEVMNAVWKLMLHALWYATLLGGIPMLLAFIKDYQEEKKRKKSRKSREKSSVNETERAR